MKAHLRSLFEHYRAHHDMGRPLLEWIGVLGCIAFPLFYVMRRAVSAAPGFDDLQLRLVASVLCLGLALRRWWPTQLRRYYIAYSYGVVFYSLSFFLSYIMLRNQGGTPAVVNMLIASVLIILLADWRNAIAMLLTGYLLAVVAYRMSDAQSALPREFIFAAGGSLLLVVGGALSHQGQKRVELQRMRMLYSGLAGSIAHEMRNPLAQVRHTLDSIAATLSSAAPQAGTPPRPQDITAMLSSLQEGRDAVSRGLQAIELTLQQLRPSPPEATRVEQVEAIACVRRAVDTYAYEDAEQKGRVRVEALSDFRFQGDPTALELVLFNLLKNALYYLPLHPAMTVTLTVTNQPTPRVLVRDTGPGIAPELAPRLFEEFQTHGKAEGTGLGLSFCRRVMRSMGGDIDCRSQSGAYTEFILRFPPEAAAQAPIATSSPAATGPSPAPLRGRSVLVVDDQGLNRAILKALATQLGLRVREASHGQQAVDLLASGPVPDAVLMDVNMPGMDGISATRAIRSLPGPASRVPVLAITANDSPDVRQEATAAGMNGMLGKPVDADQLSRTLSALLSAEPSAAVAKAAMPLSPAGLLNRQRLDDFRRMGMLDELLPESLGELAALTRRLQECVERGDAPGVQQALHSIVGLSGEAGSSALHAQARSRYRDLLEGRPPQGTAWTGELLTLLSATEEALRQDYGVSARPPAPGDQTSSHSLRV